VVVRQPAVQCLLDRRAGIDTQIWIIRADACIAADVIEVPVRVDHRLDSSALGFDKIEDPRAVFGVTAGVEDDPAAAAAQQHAVAVRLSTRREHSADQVDVRCELLRRRAG